MFFSELTSFSAAAFDDMSVLMQELNGEIRLTEEALRCMLDDPFSHLYVGVDENGRIVACGCLCVYHQPWQTDGAVESVVVLSECRGRGLGRELMEYIVSQARNLGVDELHLTSRPSRESANALYLRLGFRKKETNCYVLKTALPV